MKHDAKLSDGMLGEFYIGMILMYSYMKNVVSVLKITFFESGTLEHWE